MKLRKRKMGQQAPSHPSPHHFNTSWHGILKLDIKRIHKGKLHHEIQKTTYQNSDKNEDPLKTKKKA